MSNTFLTNSEALAINVDSESLVGYESLGDYVEDTENIFFFQNNMKTTQ